jgi:hypothetical protein
MKKLLILLATCGTLAAQSVSVRVVTNDGSLQATNTINVPAIYVQGMLALWADNSRTRTNAGLAALTFNQFASQELGDKSAEWNRRGGLDAAAAFALTQGQTNLAIPNRVGDLWGGFTQAQRTNVIQFISTVGPF